MYQWFVFLLQYFNSTPSLRCAERWISHSKEEYESLHPMVAYTLFDLLTSYVWCLKHLNPIFCPRFPLIVADALIFPIIVDHYIYSCWINHHPVGGDPLVICYSLQVGSHDPYSSMIYPTQNGWFSTLQTLQLPAVIKTWFILSL